VIWYWSLLLFPAWWALRGCTLAGAPLSGRAERTAWLIMGILLAITIGLRHEVGGDWLVYAANLTEIYEQNLSLYEIVASRDPAFAFLGWISETLGEDYFVNVVSACIFTFGLLQFCRAQPQPWLAMTIAIPYLVIVVAMGYTRQGVAIGLALLGILALQRQQLSKFLVWIVIAATFHRTAVILIALALFSSRKSRLIALLGAGVVGAVAFVLLLQEAVDHFLINYVGAEMESTGAAIRVVMNALPAVLFLLFRKRFSLPADQLQFWTWMAVSAIVFIPLLIASPSSTAVDRVALYWIPIQIFVLSRLPGTLSTNRRSIRTFTLTVLAYCLAVQLTWLVFATHASYWVPYKFFPIELIKNIL
jgi:hypothetical protein